MADAIYAPTQFRFGIAQQIAWATPITTQSAFKELDITSPVQPDYGSGVVEDTRKRSDGKRVLSHTDTYRATTGGTYIIPFECIATSAVLDYLLYGVMQDLTSEAATTPYQKIFDMDKSTVPGDFSAFTALTDAGIMFTLNGYEPATTESWSARNCILKSLTLSASPGTNGGRLTVSGEFITGFDITLGATVTPASWTAPGVTFYPFQSYANCTVAAANLVPYSFSLTMTNNAVRSGNASGNCTNYYIAQFDADMEIVAKLDAITKDMIDTYRANPADGSAEVAVIMDWGSDGVSGHLKFLMNGIYTGPTTRDFGAESGVGVALSYSGRDHGANKALVATIANALDRAWTA
jgi:hypothetical protein